MAGGKITAGVMEQGGARNGQWTNNIAIVSATTTNTGDSIRITGADGTALSTSNYGWVTLPSTATAGRLVTFPVTADVTILTTAAHWGHDTTGDVTGALLRVLAINDNGTLKWGIALLGGRNILLTTDTTASPSSVGQPEHVLCTTAVGSSSNSCREIGFVRSNYDDTGGAAENLWTNQTGINDIYTGRTADGYWQPWVPTFSGFSSAPTISSARWTQVGTLIYAHLLSSADGTSNATNFTITFPAKSARLFNGLFNYGKNNGVLLTVPGPVRIPIGLREATLYTTIADVAWTASNAKFADLELVYEVGPQASFPT